MDEKILLLKMLKIWRDNYKKYSKQCNKSLNIVGTIKEMKGVLKWWYLENKKYPEWYWRYGLHDAKILVVNTGEKKEDLSKENYMELKFDPYAEDSRGIVSITFQNYKMLKGDVHIDGCWWINDKLQKRGRKYILTLTTVNQEEIYKELKIKFCNAIVCKDTGEECK